LLDSLAGFSRQIHSLILLLDSLSVRWILSPDCLADSLADSLADFLADSFARFTRCQDPDFRSLSSARQAR